MDKTPDQMAQERADERMAKIVEAHALKEKAARPDKAKKDKK